MPNVQNHSEKYVCTREANRSLNKLKRNDVLDFLICFGEAFGQSAKKECLIEGMQHVGFIDENVQKWPDLDSIINTCTRDVPEKIIKQINDSFDVCQQDWQKKGFVSESTLDEVDFPQDEYENEERRVDRSSLSESRQRAKTINHSWQIQQREKAKLALLEKAETKEKQKRAKARKFIDLNEKFMQDLSRMINDVRNNQETKAWLQSEPTLNLVKRHWRKLIKSGESIVLADLTNIDDISESTLDLMLDTTTKDSNVAFGVVRDISYEKFTELKKLPSNKAASIKYVKEKMKLPQILFTPADEIDTEEPQENERPTDEDCTSHIHALLDNIPDLASQFLDNVEWRKLFARYIKGIKNIEPEENITESMKLDSDALLDILRRRLDSHFETHNMQNLREHSCFEWASYNLPRVCSAMVYASHIKQNLRSKRVTPSTTLLGNPCTSKQSIFCNAREESYKNLHGCYLYYDAESGKWVRSGKAGGNGKTTFESRDKEHAKAAKELRESLFYMTYPDESVDSELMEGNFQDLNQYCGMGFDPLEVDGIIKTRDGIFHWSQDINEWIQQYSTKQNLEEKETRLMLVAYLFELCYELCISIDDNKSESGGFEAAVGQHKKN